MKSRTLTCITAMALFAALAVPVQLAAQHTRYRLVDLGTLGGPNSYPSVSGEGNHILNDSGIVSSSADTAASDPYAPNCFNTDCFLAHAFRWRARVISDLGALLPGVNNSAAGSINSRGWSAGISQNGEIDPLSGSPELRAVLWADGQVVDLGTLGGNESLAEYLNDAGQVIGAAANAIPDPFSFFGFGTQTRAFLWENGVMQDLGTLGGPDAIGSFGGCVNGRRGLVAGSSYTNSMPNAATNIPTMHPFLWENGRMQDLGTLGGTFATAQCANNQGQVIGQSNLRGDPGCNGSLQFCNQHAFLWNDGTLSDLGTLGGTFSIALWLNDAGDAVGGANTTGDQAFHATLWTDGLITDLGTLPGDCFSRADVINSKGQIIGGSFNCDTNTRRAVLWNKGSIIDLNALIPANANLQLVSGTDINSRGEILAAGLLPDGDLHFVLLIPCHANEAETEDCNSGEDKAVMTQNSPTHPTMSAALPNQARLSPSEVLAAWRARWAQRYHISGVRTPKF